MSAPGAKGARGLLARIREAASASAWTKLAGRAGMYACGLAVLGVVGSGRLSAWLSPPSRIAIPVAEAAAAPLPSASASAGATPQAAGGAVADAGAPPQDGSATEDGGAAAGHAVTTDGKVILNLATEDDLRRLPGVGPKRAKAILALRVRLKRFSRVEDLLKVKGLGRRSLARLRPLVQVD